MPSIGGCYPELLDVFMAKQSQSIEGFSSHFIGT